MTSTIESPPSPSTRTLIACCAAGASSNGISMMHRVIIPLWALHLNMSPTMIGIAIGAAGFLPFLLSIHGGVLMDRFGTRRVNVILAVVSVITLILYPLLPYASALIVLQLIIGLTTSMSWMGAQSMIVKTAPGNTEKIGLFSLMARIGNLIAPVLAGVLWDLTGPTVTFLIVGLFGVCAFFAFYLAPAAEVDASATHDKTTVRDLLPRRQEYVDAVSMMAVPIIAFVCAVTFLRIAGSGVHSSFYMVYLENINISGTMIGILVGLGEGAGIFGATVAGRIERAFTPHWTLLWCHVLSVVLVCITPYLGGLLALLMLAATLRGLVHGLGQPVMFSVLSRAVSREQQGRSVGLRTTVNRIASTGVPPLMGLIADGYGVESSFLIIGTAILLIGMGLAFYAMRLKQFAP